MNTVKAVIEPVVTSVGAATAGCSEVRHWLKPEGTGGVRMSEVHGLRPKESAWALFCINGYLILTKSFTKSYEISRIS